MFRETPTPYSPPPTPIELPDESVQAQAAVSGSGSGGVGSVIAETSGGLTINLIFDAAAMAAPASFRSGIEQAASLLSAAISDKITLNFDVDYSGTGGGAAAGPDNGQWLSYSTVRADLVNNASPGDTTFNALPSGSSIQGQSSVAVWNAQLKLWGMIGATDTTTDDGSLTFATDINPSLLVGVALHELTHAMGRVPYGPQPDIFDFYRFTSPGVRLFSNTIPSSAAYFSLDGGSTKVADYGQNSDPGDFLNSGVQGPNDPFNEDYTGSTLQHLTSIDLQQLDALGFHTTASSAPAVTQTNVVSQLADGQLDALEFSSGNLTGSLLTSESFWKVVGDVDFGSTGSSQFVTQSNGQIDLLWFSGGKLSGSLLLSGGYWDVKGAGHFSGDTHAGFVTQSASGQIDFLWFDSSGHLSASDLTNQVFWNVVGVADVNGDGNSDVITQSAGGQIDILYFDHGQLVASNLLSGSYDPVRDVKSTTAGIAEFVTQNSGGQVTELAFDGNHVTRVATVGSVGLSLVQAGEASDQFLTSATQGVAVPSDPAPTAAAPTTFDGTTLNLQQASTFSSQMIGFTGNGGQGSDQIDLHGINFHTVHSSFDNTSGVLSVNDGSSTTTLHFLGVHAQDNFHFAGDGNGGTLVVAAASPSESGNQLSNAAAQDTFVFAENFGHATLANFAPATDTLQFSKDVFADLSTLVAAIHDDASGNADITDAAHDTITLQHVTTAQLLAHQSDFHIV
ncbi:NF038122 family metalloprotease [Bradyrhizobium jicamae]|uniref:NF038122 family metalloprotease n=1 Tax=Bradyrhizobium jicamae TaxID=280332 RepID=UPI001BAA040E|nr:NF038122 family metalloprotease [Bradyrhizobium jicamae]MBR0939482.1 NF038122 family metalloprotease [Bradyrhizobium jicamae]